MADPLLLSGVIKYVGVLIALAGIILTTPDGTRKGVRALRQGLARRIAPIRHTLARFLPFLRRNAIAMPATVGATATVGRATVTTTGFRWDPKAPLEERIDTLREYIVNLETRHNQLATQLSGEVSKLEEANKNLRNEFTSEVTKLRDFLEEKDERSARVDGRGLPVLVGGLLMTNLPQEIASFPWGIGWAIPVIALGLTTWSTVTLAREYRVSLAIEAPAAT